MGKPRPIDFKLSTNAQRPRRPPQRPSPRPDTRPREGPTPPPQTLNPGLHKLHDEALGFRTGGGLIVHLVARASEYTGGHIIHTTPAQRVGQGVCAFAVVGLLGSRSPARISTPRSFGKILFPAGVVGLCVVSRKSRRKRAVICAAKLLRGSARRSATTSRDRCGYRIGWP